MPFLNKARPKYNFIVHYAQPKLFFFAIRLLTLAHMFIDQKQDEKKMRKMMSIHLKAKETTLLFQSLNSL